MVPQSRNHQGESSAGFYKDKCIHCGHCDQCPTGARTILGQERSVGEVFAELLSDLPYYLSSGGGVTISGGEPLIQADYCAELLKLCKDAGINTAMESNLSLPFDNVKKVLPFLDTIFYDIKLMDDQVHRETTGVSNKHVLENARELARMGISAVVRTPLIPGITATTENICAIAGFLSSLSNVHAYELLNFNPLGQPKYEALGLCYSFSGQKPLPKAQIHALAQAAQGFGINVLYGQE